MKTPIEVKDIKRGDLLRYEYAAPNYGEVATEYFASDDALPYSRGGGQHYLLDRPTPPVELPTEPTLGWLTTSDCSSAYDKVPVGVPVLDVWRAGPHRGVSIQRNGKLCGVSASMVTAFIPAVAVPASALDELRAGWGGCERTIGTFLAAVDAANEVTV